MKINSLLAGVALMATSYTVCAQDNTVTVQTKKIGADIQPTMYGVFFEDINFGADGGLYAELIQNRDFEYTPTDRGNDQNWNSTHSWSVQGSDATLSLSLIHI